MPRTVEELTALFALERLEVDLFRGPQPETQRQRAFGGQVMGQALEAAYATVPAGRDCHSLIGLTPRRPSTVIFASMAFGEQYFFASLIALAAQ